MVREVVQPGRESQDESVWHFRAPEVLLGQLMISVLGQNRNEWGERED